MGQAGPGVAQTERSRNSDHCRGKHASLSLGLTGFDLYRLAHDHWLDWHQKQQRSVLPGDIVDRRIQDMNAIFTSTDHQQLKQLLDRYNVQYIYVGPLERIYYAGDGINKFDQPSDLWSPIYQNEQVKIYKVN